MEITFFFKDTDFKRTVVAVTYVCVCQRQHMVASTLENHTAWEPLFKKRLCEVSILSPTGAMPPTTYLTCALPFIYTWVWLCFLHASCIYSLTLGDCPALENKIHAYLLRLLLQSASCLASIWNLFLCRLSDGIELCTPTPQSFRANYFSNSYSWFYHWYSC